MSLYGTADSGLWSRQILINLATSDVLFRPPMGCKVIPVVDTPSQQKPLYKGSLQVGYHYHIKEHLQVTAHEQDRRNVSPEQHGEIKVMHAFPVGH